MSHPPPQPPSFPSSAFGSGQPPPQYGGDQPPGYGAAPAPPGYGAPPGAGPQTWPQAPPEPRTNRPAIVSLVLGVLTPCGGLPGLLSVIFGITALVQIRRTGEKGKGLAIGGLAATGLWTVAIALVVAAIVAYDASPSRSDDGQVSAESRISIDDLTTGDCLDDLPDGDRVLRITVVPCDQPHVAQVYDTLSLPDGDWPGEDAVFAEADDGCLDRLMAFPEAYDDTSVEVLYFHPTQLSWRAGDREITCVAEYLDGPRTGSLLD
jgi:hypothetical protein